MANNTTHIVEGGFLSGRNPFIFVAATPLPTFIVQLVIIVCMSRFVKIFLTPLKQPTVIAETISGIILGPTVLGHIPYFSETIFAKPSLPFLNLMSNFGLVLFLFLVGLELDPRMLKKSIKNGLAISFTGMALPFLMGVGVSYILYNYIEPPAQQTGFTKYFLFLGVAMSITAFPVLARILSELNLLKTRVGGITISAAAVDDATSWCLLALVMSLINAGSGLIALYVFLTGLGYSLFLIFAVRPLFIWLLRRLGAFENTPSQVAMFLTLMIVFVSAFITDAIGIHAIFGGFLAGIIMPHEGGFAYHITQKLEDTIAILFLPLYFALSGLRTSIGTLNDATSIGMVVLVIFVACFGKIVGCTLAARATNMNWREALTVGCLMNCKGLVELIVLNLGYDAQVISQRTFAIMVIMALVTTFITAPLVSFIYPPQYHDKVDSKKGKKPGAPSLLVSVDKIEQVPAILNVIHLLQSKLKPVVKQELKKVGSSSSISSLPSILLDVVKSNPSKSSKFVINALRLIELTERDSSVMLQTSTDALRDDPVSNMFRTFCEISKKKGHFQVHSIIKVVTMNNFGETLVTTAKQVNAKYILVPWSGSGTVVDDVTVTPLRQVFGDRKRKTSVHTVQQHSNFTQEVLNKASCTVLLLVDRGFEEAVKEAEIGAATQQIYFPFFGGKDDREALDVVCGLAANEGVKVNVVRYRNTINRKGSADSEVSTTASEDTILPQEMLTLDAQDDEILHQCLVAPGRSYGGNINYSEVESYNPVSTALQYLDHLGSCDLVVIGRGNIRMQNNGFLRNLDVERRKALGDFAEAVLLCPCKASVLIVQGCKDGLQLEGLGHNGV